MPPLVEQKNIIERVEKLYNNEYRLLSKYTGAKEAITLYHISCGHTYVIKRAKTFLNEGGGKCPKCRPKPTTPNTRSKGVSEETVIKRIKEQVGDEYSYLGGFKRMNDKVLMRHNVCGHEWNITPHMFLGSKQRRCPVCGNKARGSHLRGKDYCQTALDSQSYGGDYEWLEEYNNDNKEKLLIKHKSCDRTYRVRVNDFQQGYRCPHCSEEAKESYNSMLIKNLLKENNLKFKTEVKFKDLKHKNSLRVDFFIKELNLLIEYDGMQHFKPSGFIANNDLKKTRKRDLIKNQWVKEHEISLLRIHYKLKEKDLKNIILNISCEEELIKLVKKYNLYYDNNTTKIYNEENYYKLI